MKGVRKVDEGSEEKKAEMGVGKVKEGTEGRGEGEDGRDRAGVVRGRKETG